jgi:hypothetical protein
MTMPLDNPKIHLKYRAARVRSAMNCGYESLTGEEVPDAG